MIRDARELAAVCEELCNPDFEKSWGQVRSSNTPSDRPGLGKLADIFLISGFSEANEKLKVEWDTVAGHCEALLKLLERLPSQAMTDEASCRLAEIIYASFAAGGKRRFRQSASIQSRKARAGKKRKTKERGRIIRQAILAVCQRERLVPVASEKFAISIRSHVIEAAEELGSISSSSGMSVRSIQRHIAGMLEDLRM